MKMYLIGMLIGFIVCLPIACGLAFGVWGALSLPVYLFLPRLFRSMFRTMEKAARR